MKMHGPIIQRDVDVLDIRRAGFDFEQVSQEGLVLKVAALPTQEPTTVSIQTTSNAPIAVEAGAVLGSRTVPARQLIVGRHRWTAVIRQLILVQQHHALGMQAASRWASRTRASLQS